MAITPVALPEMALPPGWAILAVILIGYASYLIIWVKFISPTAHVPGAFIDKVCGIRLAINTLMGRKMYFVQEQLRKYGNLVEAAPNWLGCSETNAVKTIYSSHEWAKTDFYAFGDINGTPTLFSELRPRRAQILRKAFLPAFSRANLVAMSLHIFSHLEKFLLKLDEFEKEEKPLEAYRWTRYLTFEVITDVGFGAEYDMISNGKMDHPFVADFDDSISWSFVTKFFGWGLSLIPKILWPESMKNWSTAIDRSENHARDGIEKWRKQKAAGETGLRVDIMQRLIDHGEKYPEEKLTEHELTVEIMEIMLAGADTTATTLMYAMWELTRFPQVQSRLRAALRQVIPDVGAKVSLQQIESCEYLHHTVLEMLRTHPTLPSFLERYVPKNGAVIAGHKLRSGTVVAMSALVQQYREDIFPQPCDFAPERWANETSVMKANSLAFSTGPRSCVGQNLAIMQMKIHMGTIIRNFEVTCHPSVTRESMAAVDLFQGKPKAGKCLLYFKRVKD